MNCSDESNSSNTIGNNEVLTDDPSENVILLIKEYVLVTPQIGSPFYGEIPVGGGTYTNWPPYGYTKGNFTTPDDDRTIEGTRYQTQYFIITKGTTWRCETTNCGARFSINNGVLSEDHLFSSGSCNSGYNCATGTTCGSYSDVDNVNLSENTTYNYSVGADCLVGDKWENE